MKKCIALLGATTRIGSSIAERLSTSSDRLLLVSNEEENLISLKKDLQEINPSSDISLVACPIESSWEADTIILALDTKTELEVVASIKDVSTQKVVISVSDVHQSANNNSIQDLEALLPYSKILKALLPLTGIVNDILLDGRDQFALKEAEILFNGNCTTA
jgi:predicted dinucleotide-binding enzyme